MEREYRILLPPFRGGCVVCGEAVYHWYPWWNKNPDTHPDEAQPYHDDCWSKTFSDEACPP